MTPDPESATRDSRYAWLLGTAGVLVVVLFTLNSLAGDGSRSGRSARPTSRHGCAASGAEPA